MLVLFSAMRRLYAQLWTAQSPCLASPTVPLTATLWLPRRPREEHTEDLIHSWEDGLEGEDCAGPGSSAGPFGLGIRSLRVPGLGLEVEGKWVWAGDIPFVT